MSDATTYSDAPLPPARMNAGGDDMVVLGLPSVITEWAFDFFGEIGKLLAHPVRICPVCQTDDIEKIRLANDGYRLLFLAQYPSPSLIAAIMERQVAVVAFVEDPIDAVAAMKRALKTSIVDALRYQTQASTGAYALRRNDRVLQVDRKFPGTVDRMILQILEHLGLQLVPDGLQRLCNKYCGGMGTELSVEAMLAKNCRSYAPPGEVTDVISDEEVDIIKKVLTPLIGAYTTGEITPIVWPHKVFFWGDRPNEFAPLAADVAGQARIIYYGPYFGLPPGHYEARVILGASNDIGKLPLTIEMVHGEGGLLTVAKAYVRIEGGGIFAGRFVLHHTESYDPLELRLRSDEGAIEGRISLAWVEFRWLSMK